MEKKFIYFLAHFLPFLLLWVVGMCADQADLDAAVSLSSASLAFIAFSVLLLESLVDLFFDFVCFLSKKIKSKKKQLVTP